MQNVLGNFIKAPNENGNILLVNMPPGTGKTFASSSAIARHVRSGDPRRVIFITPYKKNLPLDYYDEEGNRRDGELRKAFAREGIPELYDEYVINLQPVAEHVLRAGAEMLRNGNSELLRSFLDDRRFYNEIEAHFRLALEQGGSKRQFDMMVENFRLLENQLRRRIHRRLDSVGKKASERHQYIVDEFPWLRDLYPEVDVYEKKVILLSSSKFIYPFDPIIAPSGSFYESDLLRDSVIFMDEFDSIKLDWLNNLVNRDNRRRIELVNLYTRIHWGLMNRGNHARQYYRDADAGKEGFAERDGLAFIADNVAEAFCTDFKTYNLQYDFKLIDEGPGGFIFHDYNTITIGRSSKMDIETDGDEPDVETEEDAEEAPVDDDDAEEVSEDVGDDVIDSEGDSDATDGESEDTEEYEPEIFVNDSAESIVGRWLRWEDGLYDEPSVHVGRAVGVQDYCLVRTYVLTVTRITGGT